MRVQYDDLRWRAWRKSQGVATQVYIAGLQNTEMVSLKRDFHAFDADVVVDFHEYRPYRADYVDMGEFGVTCPFDVMFMYSGNLNVPEAIRTANESLLIDPARAAMERAGRQYANYFRPIVIRGKKEFRSAGSNPVV